ncbi:phospho-sugar mutase [Saccharopolyspora shandongensis]|uniref:phospho-sugar mutase n=1 Tax=Saccharopolyspora shandongensis TaxID=418495 RepID=UPI0034404ABD
MVTDPRLAVQVQDWIEHDPDPDTRRELQALLDSYLEGRPEEATRASDELRSRFSGPLRFQTAGLRGAVGAGQTRMNRAVVIRATAGLADYLRHEVGDAVTVIIGFDGRHGSARFARDAAGVVTAAGGTAILFDSAVPTPLLAFAMRYLDADAGIMVTASHNPAPDNGYKVYLGGSAESGTGRGAQIVNPTDTQISARIDAAPHADEVPRSESGWKSAGSEIVDAYLARLGTLAPNPKPSSLKIVLTPLHGVGGEVAVRALTGAGFSDVHLVPEQALPDPDFPTAPFPNPEEPGTLDHAFALASELRADLVLALDPDADRCAAAVPDPSTPESWRQLTGDEVGALLGSHIASAAVAAGHTQGVLASSLVSSRLLAKIAHAHGLKHHTTLTGFKWITRVDNLIFGYEEALGYCIDPDAVRDKDGISACVAVALLSDELRQRDQTLLEALDAIAGRHGRHVTRQMSFRSNDLTALNNAVGRLVEKPPAELAGSPIDRFTDLAEGGELPPTPGVCMTTEAGDQVVIRPSGTEPKLKCYLEVVSPLPGDDPRAEELAHRRIGQICHDVESMLDLSPNAARSPVGGI